MVVHGLASNRDLVVPSTVGFTRSSLGEKVVGFLRGLISLRGRLQGALGLESRLQ